MINFYDVLSKWNICVLMNMPNHVVYYIAGGQHDYCNDFDLRKPLDRHFFSGINVDCVSIKDSPNLTALQDCCAGFLAKFSRCSNL